MLLGAVKQIRANHEQLSRLDGAIGDGDHGTTILRTMETVEKTVAENPAPDFKKLLAAVGWAVMSADGGSTGPLLGSFFTGMAEPAAGKTELDAAALSAMFDGGLAKMQKISRAQLGDKTMMDALMPAVAALKTPQANLALMLQAAAAAADQGAQTTKNFRAKFGRAKNLGDRTIGHPDPGAVSISLIFKGFSEAIPV